MDKLRLEKIERIYQAVLDGPEDLRERLLADSCDGDEDLRSEVESLLRFENKDSSFIDSPPELLAADVFEGSSSELAAGDKISHYTIQRLLGEGGMGQVYLASDERLRRNVALKIFPPTIADDAESLMRFEREAQAVSALNHPNILTVYEFGEHQGVHYIATEFIDGITLRSSLLAAQPRPAQALEIAIQALSALEAAHEAGITHRDIKPENIMIRRDGYVKVLDFGLAKLAHPDKSTRTHSGSEDPTVALHQTKPGAVMGTAAYMSPEQARGLKIDARSDIWSLAVVLYEMLAGSRPFMGETHADIIVAILGSEPASLAEPVESVSAELEGVIRKALEKKAEARFQTAGEFKAELEAIKLGLGTKLPSTVASAISSAEKAAQSTAIMPDAPGVTDGRAPRATSDGREGNEPAHLSSMLSFRAVVSEVRSHKLRSAIAAVLLIGVASLGAYFALNIFRSDAIDSIAVLPFDNSGDPELQFISDGLSESLIDRFAQLPQLKVISRNSSFKFRGSDVDLGSIAAQLGVRSIVTGKVTRVGDELVIRVDVIDALENRQLAGGQYRRKGGDLLGLQSEIAQNTIEKFRVRLTDGQSRRMAERNTENSESYRYYLNGLVLLNDKDVGRDKALDYFQKAIDLDPDFALAWAEIAWIYLAQANASSDPDVQMPKARAAVEKALALDPELAKARVVRAMIYEYEFEWTKAEGEYRQAIELSPNLDFARNNYAFFLSVLDRQNEALAQLEEQRIRDPLNRRLLLLQKAIVLVQARRFDEALQAYQEAQAVEPSKGVPDFALGYAYAGKGLRNEAITYYRKSVADLGGEEKYSQPLVYLAATYAGMPDKRAEAKAILARIEAMNEYVSPALLAVVYTALSDNDKAMELLERAFARRDLLLRFIRTGYEYDGLRTDPRFADLEKRIGMR